MQAYDPAYAGKQASRRRTRCFTVVYILYIEVLDRKVEEAQILHKRQNVYEKKID